jgi:hypothetical protein
MFDTDCSEHFLSSRSVDQRLLPVLVVSIVNKVIELETRVEYKA